MEDQEEREILRDVEAVMIPSGDKITLTAGTKVRITQSLGGTYTVMSNEGYLSRISEANKDALGIEDAGAKDDEASEPAELIDRVWNQLKTVYDPEIPVNIVDLGLVYDCQIVDKGESKHVEVKMTLTAPGCGMGPTIAADAQSKIMTIDEIDHAHVDLVWDPPWNQDMITEEGKMRLGMV